MAATTRDNEGGSAGEMPDEFNARRLIRRLAGLGVLVGLVALAVGSLPGLGTLRTRFGQADAVLVGLIGVLKLGSCLSNVLAFRDVFCPRMSWRFSYQLGMAEQATNVLLPTGGAGGLALGAWALRQGSMSTEHIARRSVVFFVLTSIPNFACAAILGPLLLSGVFSGHVPVAPTVIFSALAWGTVAVIATLPLMLRRIDPDKGRRAITGRLRSGAVVLGKGIDDTGMLLRSWRWRAIVGAIGYLSFDIAALITGFAAFGGRVPLAALVFGYVVGQLGGLIPIPGGIGGIDGGLIGALVLYGSPLPQAAAAVLAYRAFQLGVPAALGAIAFVRLRGTLNSSADPTAACAPLADSSPVPAVQTRAGW
jgi:uncharacterized membrane protein YbhN (UPF0104 family)